MATEVTQDLPLVGRERELERLGRHLKGGSLPPVLYLYGSPGIGKTALLRELKDRHSSLSWSWREATRLGEDDRPETDVVVVDSVHPRLAGSVRDRLAPALLAGSRVFVAARRPPEPGWLESDWDSLVVPVELGGLDRQAVVELLARIDVDSDAIESLIGWARGVPLAMELAAQGGADPFGPDGDIGLATRFEERLLALDRKVSFEALEGDPMAVVEAVGVASAVDGVDLAALLPDVDTRPALSWLAELSVVSSHGARLGLHRGLRWAIGTRLAETQPDRLRELRRRWADHAARRASRGERSYLLELADMVLERDLAWGIGVESASRFRVDTVRSEDVAAVGRWLEGQPRRRAGLRRWMQEAPGHVQAIRGDNGVLAGLSVSLSVGDAPEWAAADPVAGPWLEHARVHHAPDEAVLLRDALVLVEGEDRSEVATVGNAGLGTGRGFTTRWLYALVEPHLSDQVRFAEAMGYERFPALDVNGLEAIFHCYRVDLGPDGLVGATHALVYRQLGLDPPPAATRLSRSDVVEALRGFHQPSTLLANPLGGEATGDERIAAVRDRVRVALEKAFGDDDLDRLRREAVYGAYLNPDGSHAATARALHLSRATYFRRLSEGVAKVVGFLMGKNREEADTSPDSPADTARYH